MENKPIFLSMAAIDMQKAEQYRRLPDKLFPLQPHRIAAAGWSDDCNELTGRDRKRNICKCFGFSF